MILIFASAIALAVGPSVTAIPTEAFLNSIGVNSAICRRGETLDKTTQCVRYLGLRWFRSGPEGDPPIPDLIELHRQTGARFSWGCGSGGSDLAKVIATGKQLADAGALLAFEGPNEPNNWGLTYAGQAGGRNLSWIPVADLQRDLYSAVKSDPKLKAYPVWGISEEGAETDNVGLQFLTIPAGAGTSLPAGTRFADFANVHNYIYHPNSPGIEDNKTWNASDPTPACRVDGLYGEYGRTWARHFQGYSAQDLLSLPRVTTETGCAVDGPITERIHGLNLLSLYLDQFKRGWSHTAVYLLRDRVDEGGNQQYGFYKPDYSPRLAGVYLHNMTSILADTGRRRSLGKLNYRIPDEPATVHDMLLQRSDGRFQLVVWSERVTGRDSIQVDFGSPRRETRIYDPTVGIACTQSLRNVSTIALDMSDHPIVIELSGG